MELHDIPYKVAYRPIKYPRIEFKTGELLIVLPFGGNPTLLLDKYKHWIVKQLNFIEECLHEAKDKKLTIRSEEEFRKLIHALANEISAELNVKWNRIYFRNMKTKWASMSPAKNLTVNWSMRYLPEYLIRYVVFHEMVHLIERTHNETFWGIISREFTHYQAMERELFIYWFLISKKE